jgi:ribosomal protein S18 acetylase RimI-like enzyme
MTEQGAKGIQVRPMRLGDAAAVAALSGQLGYAASACEVEARIAELLGRDDHALMVATGSGERVVGWVHVCATLLLSVESRAEVRGLVVDEAARGRGIGGRLMEAAEWWAKERGFAVMGLSSRQHREEAHRFYERLGYEVVKTSLTFRKALV